MKFIQFNERKLRQQKTVQNCYSNQNYVHETWECEEREKYANNIFFSFLN